MRRSLVLLVTVILGLLDDAIAIIVLPTTVILGPAADTAGLRIKMAVGTTTKPVINGNGPRPLPIGAGTPIPSGNTGDR